jgi:hypothetical protein
MTLFEDMMSRHQHLDALSRLEKEKEVLKLIKDLGLSPDDVPTHVESIQLPMVLGPDGKLPSDESQPVQRWTKETGFIDAGELVRRTSEK